MINLTENKNKILRISSHLLLTIGLSLNSNKILSTKSLLLCDLKIKRLLKLKTIIKLIVTYFTERICHLNSTHSASVCANFIYIIFEALQSIVLILVSIHRPIDQQNAEVMQTQVRVLYGVLRAVRRVS